MKELLGIVFVGIFALVALSFGLGMLATDGELIGDLTVDQMVATEVASGRYVANTATPEPIPGPSSTPTPAMELAAPAEAVDSPNGQVTFTSFSAQALVVLFDTSGVGLAHYSAPPTSFVGGDLSPLNDGQAVTIVGLARTSAERLVMLATDGQITYAPLMRDGRVVFYITTGQPVVTMEKFDELLPKN